MRIYILSTEEGVFHPGMFYDILKEHSASITGAAIFPSKESLCSGIIKCVRIDGLKSIGRLVKYGVIFKKTQIFNQKPRFATVRDVFKYFGINVDYFNNPNELRCIERIRSLSCDVVFNNQPVILRKPILSISKTVFLNRHTSKLPEYRGLEPVFHALLDGNSVIGVSIHSMVSDIDAGELYAQTTFPAGKSVFECYAKAFSLSPQVFSQALDNLSRGVSLLTIDAKTTKCYKRPVKSEITRFRGLGLTYF